MNQNEVDKVKLVSVKIDKFKTLQKGTVSWEYDAYNRLEVIDVQDFHRMYLSDIYRNIIKLLINQSTFNQHINMHRSYDNFPSDRVRFWA